MYNTPYMAPYNPMAPMQQRLQQYEQNYGQMAQPQGAYKPQNFIKCQAVTSIDEAKAAMIDFDGSVHVFTDLANNRIYTKQINLDGAAVLNVYELKAPQQGDNALEKRVDELEAIVLSLKEDINNGKSNASDSGNRTTKKQPKSNDGDGANV